MTDYSVWMAGFVVTFRYNLAKVIIIAATAIGGSAPALGPSGITATSAFSNTVQAVPNAGFIWAVLFIVMAAAGFYVQW